MSSPVDYVLAEVKTYIRKKKVPGKRQLFTVCMHPEIKGIMVSEQGEAWFRKWLQDRNVTLFIDPKGAPIRVVER